MDRLETNFGHSGRPGQVDLHSSMDRLETLPVSSIGPKLNAFTFQYG